MTPKTQLLQDGDEDDAEYDEDEEVVTNLTFNENGLVDM